MWEEREDTPQRLAGMVENVTFQNEENGFTVLTLADEVGELVTVVGILAGSAPGESLVLTGQYVEHAAYGRQFEAETCTYLMPEDAGAIAKYLGSGVLPGIGPSTAGRIVERFGDAALEVLASTPERYAEVRGMSIEKALKAGRRFMEVFGIREAVASLSRLGLSAAEAILAYRHYGRQTVELIEQNPYRLCGYPSYLAFARVDAMAEHLALPRDNRHRVRAALLYTLRHNLGNGHTCLPVEKLLGTACGFFGIDEAAAQFELAACCELGDAQQVHYGGEDYVYLPEPFRAEMTAALRIRAMAAMPPAAPAQVDALIAQREAMLNIHYAPLQKQAIAEALSHGVMVITGGPGTGKTTAVNAIIALYEQQAERVLLAAPTGRAAKRMAELTGRKAATIHRLLEVDFSRGDEFPRFKRNEKNPLRCDVLIVDEMSMVDAMLFEALLAALRPGCRLVMVGDADQLPSVGAGNVLRGIIESGVVPTVALTEIFRQAAASLIVKNAHHIVAGELPEKGGKADDFFFMRAVGSACQQLVCSLVAERLPNSYGFSPVEDIQVLCPGRKGPLGTEAMNARLQQLLNPPGPDKPEIRRFEACYRLGDKVMQVRNNYDLPWTREDGEPGAGAFNGEIGTITQVNPAAGTLTVRCEDRHLAYTAENLHELELAYAVTIHKSQGSEFEAVVIPLSEVPGKLQYRNLLYTGVTRAKRLCILPGEERILETMVRAGRKNRRYSCFAHFLTDEELL
ncbi:MAG: ATP-dependent RecD-like DNA helicase [Ruminococcaceae bacterium]|nr:ATP-dependent RecD-like DNA helicase [Oscillospiraceae bacterium]